jgi:hypothetical protein
MPLNTAIRHLKSGNWQKAHAVVQNDASEFGCWAHGIVHMLEGDRAQRALLVPARRAQLRAAPGSVPPRSTRWSRRGRRSTSEREASAGIDAIVPEIAEQAMPDDERVWVPQAPDVWFRPLLLNTVSGGWCNLLRVRRAGVLSRHRHPMVVTGYVIRGRWRYLEHDWVARPAASSTSRPARSTRWSCPTIAPR